MSVFDPMCQSLNELIKVMSHYLVQGLLGLETYHLLEANSLNLKQILAKKEDNYIHHTMPAFKKVRDGWVDKQLQ